MDYELPTEFDIIVIGTGIIESTVSAAASRIGKRVLHIDNNNYYGGSWASFNLDCIDKLAKNEFRSTEMDLQNILKENEQLEQFGNNLFNAHNFSQEWHIPERQEETLVSESGDSRDSLDTPWTQQKLLENARKFNIDIAPKLHFARGDFVELLISSNIARYSEFRSVSRVMTYNNDQLEVVPCSRADVFSSSKVSAVEKRILMKLLTECMDEEGTEFKEFEDKTFRAYLEERKLTDNLIHYVLYTISMSTDQTPFSEGVANAKRFLNSIGRYGKTPFLYSMYGSGEITQAFCRLSAVFGGVYALNQSLNGLIFNKENFTGLICGKQRINANHLVVGIEKSPEKCVNALKKGDISRAVFITNKSIMESEKEHLTLLMLPPQDGKNSCTILEMGTLTGTCPKDLYLVHVITKQVLNPKDDLKHCVDKLFGDESNVDKPSILWSFYYSLPDVRIVQENTSNNVFVCPGPNIELDYDNAIEQAKAIFNKMYPDTEFLPRAPDPEEIVIEGEECDNSNPEEQSVPTAL